MIIGFVRVYNSAKYLAGCLDSVKDKVDRILVGDGWFPWKDPPGNASWDESQTIAKRCLNVQWIPAPKIPYASEIEKNNRMLAEVPEGSWILYIDPDEQLVGDIRELIGAIGYSCDIIITRVEDPSGTLYYARLFRYQKGVEFVDHRTLRWPGARVPLYFGKIPERVWLKHVRPP